ncbi:hypothetical protein BDR05DRAFT_953226 [Suillus weaverae]|nr:hypothetical protein BDR05DRAFT_953226 [Suillus weaverae]
MAIAPASSFTFSIPHSEPTAGHSSISLSEFHTLIAIDANSYHDHNETVRRMEASMAALTSDVSDITEKVLAQGATLDATYQLAQDSMASGESVRMVMHDMNSTMKHIEGDVSVMKLEFAALRAMLERKFETLIGCNIYLEVVHAEKTTTSRIARYVIDFLSHEKRIDSALILVDRLSQRKRDTININHVVSHDGSVRESHQNKAIVPDGNILTSLAGAAFEVSSPIVISHWLWNNLMVAS